jgi:c-di-GMP-binding flagellar brake protein YcgR
MRSSEKVEEENLREIISQSVTVEPKIERRAFKRVRLINWPAKIIVKDKSMNGTARNISPKGAFVYYFQPHGDDLPLQLHKVVDLIIQVPRGASLFICAEVIWSNILSSDEKNTLLGMGLRFIEVPDKELQFLYDFVTVHTNTLLKCINKPAWN